MRVPFFRFVERGIYTADPFVSVDKTGVGRLMKISSAEGRETRPDIKLGICGEHGGDRIRSTSVTHWGLITSLALPTGFRSQDSLQLKRRYALKLGPRPDRHQKSRLTYVSRLFLV